MATYNRWMRVVSLLASGTELLCAVGAGDSLVGRSHECDSPAWVTRLPCVSRPTFDVSGSSAQTDRLVREKIARGEPLYEIDRALLQALAPELVIAQSHCEVCAVTASQLDAAHSWPGLEGLRTVSMSAGSLAGILRDFQLVSRAVGYGPQGEALCHRLRATMEGWRRATAGLARPRVVCLEWTDPPFPMGNWGPELVELAGGDCVLGSPGAHSAAARWDQVLAADPELLVVAPCGFGLARAEQELPALAERPGWRALRAVRDGRVYVADGNLYFNRSGPMVFDTVGLLAEMLHPDRFAPKHEGSLYRRVATAA
jgi:iron complex transport system substrate-binding protein